MDNPKYIKAAMKNVGLVPWDATKLESAEGETLNVDLHNVQRTHKKKRRNTVWSKIPAGGEITSQNFLSYLEDAD